MSALLHQITSFCDQILNISKVQDWPGSLNGLQLENFGKVTRIGAAVDASERIIEKAIRNKIDFLIVHHGLFWGNAQPLTGPFYHKMSLAIKHNLAVYSSHLPLDLHPEIGNNAVLFKLLGLKKRQPFGMAQSQIIGFKGECELSLTELSQRLEKITHTPVLIVPGGPKKIRRVGIISGGAGEEVSQAVKEGLDVLITGEGPHWTFPYAHENKINILYGGHYATETFGVKALAEKLSKKFKVGWEFLDDPSGL
jgi:dinuclear metal center YbgI/SA1388 family protein